MSNDKSNITEILERVEAEKLDDDGQEFLLYALLASMNRNKELTLLMQGAKDSEACYEKILSAVKFVKGPKYGFSGHGMIKPIASRFSDEQCAEIIALIHRLGTVLDVELGVKSFITSGTLLGLIREKRFIPHDDDFDVAYVSCHKDEKAILQERRRIFNVINNIPEFKIEERTGGRAAIFVKSKKVQFNFDLFAGFERNGFFNEFPLKPKTLQIDEILPVRTMKFYGTDIFVPNNPEALLELNYGKNWVKPDPTFRFNFGEHRWFYKFLIQNPIESEEQ